MKSLGQFWRAACDAFDDLTHAGNHSFQINEIRRTVTVECDGSTNIDMAKIHNQVLDKIKAS